MDSQPKVTAHAQNSFVHPFCKSCKISFTCDLMWKRKSYIVTYRLLDTKKLAYYYRSGTINSKSFVSKVLLRIKWKFELTVHFKHEMLGKL